MESAAAPLKGLSSKRQAGAARCSASCVGVTSTPKQAGRRQRQERRCSHPLFGLSFLTCQQTACLPQVVHCGGGSVGAGHSRSIWVGLPVARAVKVVGMER